MGSKLVRIDCPWGGFSLIRADKVSAIREAKLDVESTCAILVVEGREYYSRLSPAEVAELLSAALTKED